MSHAAPNQPFPRKALFAVAALIGFALIAVVAARISGLSPAQAGASPVVHTLDLRFDDRANGAVLVRDARTGAGVAELPPASNGFVRGVLRSLVRERRTRDLGDDHPFRLARHADGRLSLEDVATGRVIELNAFGATNVGAFAALLDEPARVAAH